MRIKDSYDLALAGLARHAPGFDRAEDEWPRRWAEAYVDFARRREARLAARPGHALVPDRRLGRSAAATSPTATATRSRASTSPGAPAPASSTPFERRVREAVDARAAYGCASATGSTTSSSPAARSPACAGAVLEPSSVERGDAVLARAVAGSSRSPPRRSIVTPAASAATTSWSGASWPQRLGTAAGADALRASPRTSTAGCSGSPRRPARNVINRRPHVALRRGHPQLGPDLADARRSGSCPGPRRSGSTPSAGGCPCRSSPASTRSARSSHPAHDRPRPQLVRADPEDHREGVRALGLRAEPRPDRQERARRCSRSASGSGPPAPSRRSRSKGEDFVVGRLPAASSCAG